MDTGPLQLALFNHSNSLKKKDNPMCVQTKPKFIVNFGNIHHKVHWGAAVKLCTISHDLPQQIIPWQFKEILQYVQRERNRLLINTDKFMHTPKDKYGVMYHSLYPPPLSLSHTNTHHTMTPHHTLRVKKPEGCSRTAKQWEVLQVFHVCL